MAGFARRFHWAFLTCSASFLFAYFIGLAANLDAHQSQRPEAQDPGISSEAANFDAFLDMHPEIDAQLRTNPVLINDQKWVLDHRELAAYFDHHPQAKTEIAESPSYFIRREGRRASREARQRSENSRKEEIANFQQFLNSNPRIRRQLNADPLLIKEPKYLDGHPGLQAYLYDHPLVNKDLREDPRVFLQVENEQNNPTQQKGAEDRGVQGQAKQTDTATNTANRERGTHDQRQAIGGADVRGQTKQYGERPRGLQTSPAKGEIVSFDQFLDRHPEMSQQLSSNPSLITNTQYLEQHPGLRTYLDDHPTVKKEVIETPSYFARREVQTQYDALEARRPRAVGTDQMAGSSSSQRSSISSVPILTASEITSFDQFLSEHKRINKDLEKNPVRVNDTNYLRKNRDLQDYLNQHAGLREELRQHPTYLMNRRNRYELSVAEQTNYTRSTDSANSAITMTRLSQKDLRATDRFLEKHKNINNDLEKNPSLAGDPDYLKKHKDFREFLEQNPDIKAAVRKDPVRFMQNQHDRFERMNQKM
jgi:phage-related protein